MDKYETLGRSEFWAKYSVDGVSMSMTAILKCLRDDRRVDNKKMVQGARKEFGQNFGDIFCYYKARSRPTINDEGAIARRYRKLLWKRRSNTG